MSNNTRQDLYYFERWLDGVDEKGCFGFLLPHRKRMIHNIRNADPLFKGISITEWKGDYDALDHPKTILRIDREFVFFDTFRKALTSDVFFFLDTDQIEINVRNGQFALKGIKC